jgi:hypothetical protein
VPAYERLVATAIANRVASVNTIFFGRLLGVLNTDWIDVNQGVELMWREFSGLGPATALRRSITAALPQVRETLRDPSAVGREAASLAVDAIEALLDTRISDQECVRRVVAAAVGVAVHFDHSAVQVPAGFRTWASFELTAEASYFDAVGNTEERDPVEMAKLLRSRSGEDSMVYRYAMKDLLR